MTEKHKRVVLLAFLTLALILVAYSSTLPPSPDDCGPETLALYGTCSPPLH